MSTIYALIKTDDDAPVFDDAQGDDIAIEAICMDHLNDKMRAWGVEVIEIEMPDNPTCMLKEKLVDLELAP